MESVKETYVSYFFHTPLKNHWCWVTAILPNQHFMWRHLKSTFRVWRHLKSTFRATSSEINISCDVIWNQHFMRRHLKSTFRVWRHLNQSFRQLNHLLGTRVTADIFLAAFNSPTFLHRSVDRSKAYTWAELTGACYRKMPKSVLKKETWFDFTIETYIHFKKGQILNKF